MTNYEKYKDEIDKIWESEDDFGVTKDNKVKSCMEISPCRECIFDSDCSIGSQKWLVSEYKDPAENVDWSKVPVDTPILVKDYENDEWLKRYFAGINADRKVITFDSGATSWSDNGERMVIDWNYAKLANPDDLKESEFYQEKREHRDEELIDMLVANYVEKENNDAYFNQKNYRKLLEAVYWFWRSYANDVAKVKLVEAVKSLIKLPE